MARVVGPPHGRDLPLPQLELPEEAGEVRQPEVHRMAGPVRPVLLQSPFPQVPLVLERRMAHVYEVRRHPDRRAQRRPHVVDRRQVFEDVVEDHEPDGTVHVEVRDVPEDDIVTVRERSSYLVRIEIHPQTPATEAGLRTLERTADPGSEVEEVVLRQVDVRDRAQGRPSVRGIGRPVA